MKNKVLLIGLHDDSNLGDLVISDCAKEQILQNIENCEIERVSLNCFEKSIKFNILELIILIILRIIRKVYSGIDEFIQKIHYNSMCRITLQVIGKPSVIFIGGGGLIKYRHQYFGTILSAVTWYAETNNIPIYYYGVGVEGYDDNNWRCKVLKTCLNSKSVKYISTRDDLETLQNKYMNPGYTQKVVHICDPAVWASEVYGIKKMTICNSTQVIGINVSYGNLFFNYGINFNSIDYEYLLINIISELYKKYNIIIYTNGGDNDNEFAKYIKNKLNQNNINIELLIPSNGRELTSIISRFSCILASRLHSSIIAYSLNVPSVPMVWNEKVTFFSKLINNDFLLTPDNFNVEFIREKLEMAVNWEYNQEKRKEFRNTINNFLKNINFDLNCL